MAYLVTGATGMIGKQLLSELSVSGQKIRVLTRNVQSAGVILGSAVQCLEWDYRNGPVPEAAWEGVDTVIHLMGENIGAGRWTSQRKQRIRDSRILSARKLIADLPASVKTFLSASAIGYYPGHLNKLYDESFTVEESDGFLAEVVRDWEQQAREAATTDRRVIYARFGVILGMGGFLKRILPLYRLGLGGPIGSGRQWMSWIHVEDAARLILFALDREEISGPINVVSPNPVTNGQFNLDLARALRNPAFLPVPAMALRLLMGEAADLALGSHRVEPGVAVKHGFSFHFSTLSDTLTDILSK